MHYIRRLLKSHDACGTDPNTGYFWSLVRVIWHQYQTWRSASSCAKPEYMQQTVNLQLSRGQLWPQHFLSHPIRRSLSNNIRFSFLRDEMLARWLRSACIMYCRVWLTSNWLHLLVKVHVISISLWNDMLLSWRNMSCFLWRCFRWS